MIVGKEHSVGRERRLANVRKQPHEPICALAYLDAPVIASRSSLLRESKESPSDPVEAIPEYSAPALFLFLQSRLLLGRVFVESLRLMLVLTYDSTSKRLVDKFRRFAAPHRYGLG